jgi:hypothetical protein
MKTLFTLLLCLLASPIFAQPPIRWDVSYHFPAYGNVYGEVFTLPHPAGGYLAATTVKTLPQSYCYLLFRVDPAGNLLWHQTYGSTSADYLADFDYDPSTNRYMLSGKSFGGISGQKTVASLGGSDIWVVWVDAAGTLYRQRAYGTANNDDIQYAVPPRVAADRAYVFAGREITYSSYGELLPKLAFFSARSGTGYPLAIDYIPNTTVYDTHGDGLNHNDDQHLYTYTPDVLGDALVSIRNIYDPGSPIRPAHNRPVNEPGSNLMLTKVTRLKTIDNINKYIAIGTPILAGTQQNTAGIIMYNYNTSNSTADWGYPRIQAGGYDYIDRPLNMIPSDGGQDVDGHFLIAGTGSPSGNFHLSKISKTGGFIWDTEYGTGTCTSLVSGSGSSILLGGKRNDAGFRKQLVRLVQLNNWRAYLGTLLARGWFRINRGNYRPIPKLETYLQLNLNLQADNKNLNGKLILEAKDKQAAALYLEVSKFFSSYTDGKWIYLYGQAISKQEEVFTLQLGINPQTQEVELNLWDKAGQAVLLTDEGTKLEDGEIKAKPNNSSYKVAQGKFTEPEFDVTAEGNSIAIAAPEDWGNGFIYSVYTLSGQLIASGISHSQELKLNDQPHGRLLIIRLTNSEGKSLSKKLWLE